MNDTKQTPQAEHSHTGYQFGTFKGVFTPSILTILGVIMYLRFGWVLGNVGLFKTLIIVTIATTITFLTGLSISSLATNMKVGGGGTYFIISRSLGLEAGTAVSLPLYLAQTLGISFYIAGFSEAFVSIFPFFPFKLVCIITLLILAIISYISADIALKTQFIILALLAMSLISFFLGSSPNIAETASTTAPRLQPFWIVFAVFFPAVTGIEAGLAMSGDLKNPAKSLPLGILLAITTSYIIYLIIPIFLNVTVQDKQILLINPFIIKDVARWKIFIVLGVWGATLSSALGALLGAPRTLQALARDKVIPPIIGKGFGTGGDPRIAIVISFIVAFIGIIAGGLNVIAPILTMFFLTAYGILNLSAAFEGLIGSPSWRPKFNVHWRWSFIGACYCFAAMFMINAGATFIALIVSFVVYLIVKKRNIITSWQDTRYGILMLVLYYIIHRLEERKPDERTWRPNLLVLSGPPSTRWHLIEFADAITCKRGLLTVTTILPESASDPERLDTLRSTLRNYMKENHVRALMNINTSYDMLTGAQEMIKAYGFGSVTPNTIIIGETEKKENFLNYAQLISLVHRQRRNLIIMRKGELQPKPHEELRMDVLWRGKQKNAGLMLAIAYLIKISEKWDTTHLILKTIVNDESKKKDAQKRLDEFIKWQYLKAESAIIVNQKNEDPFKIIEDNIHDANLAFIGMRPPNEDESIKDYSLYYEDLLNKTAHFPTTIMTLASENIEFNRIFAQDK